MTYEVRYVRDAWYMAGWSKDFPAGKPWITYVPLEGDVDW